MLHFYIFRSQYKKFKFFLTFFFVRINIVYFYLGNIHSFQLFFISVLDKFCTNCLLSLFRYIFSYSQQRRAQTPFDVVCESCVPSLTSVSRPIMTSFFVLHYVHRPLNISKHKLSFKVRNTHLLLYFIFLISKSFQIMKTYVTNFLKVIKYLLFKRSSRLFKFC